MPTNEFKPFATGVGANVVSPATWSSNQARLTGFQAGTAASNLVNTAIRQSSSVSAMIAQFITDSIAQNVVDDGNLGALEAQFIASIQSLVGTLPQASLWHWGRDNGSVNAMTVSCSPVISSYTDGLVVATIPNNSNSTTTPTLSANGLTAATIVRSNATAVQAGDIAVNTLIAFQYDSTGSVWRIIGGVAIPQIALMHFGADVGTTNAMTVTTADPPIATVTTGMHITVKKGATQNTGALTLTVASTTAAVTWANGTAMREGDWAANAPGMVVYEGGVYRLLGVTTPFSFTIPGVSPPLLAPRTYYVSSSTGSDSNTGLAVGVPFQTIQKAMDVTETFNFNGFSVTIIVADGSYAPFECPPINGSGNVIVTGNIVTPANVTVTASTNEAITVLSGGRYTLNGLRVVANGSSSGNHLSTGVRCSGIAQLGYFSFGACAHSHIYAENGGTVTMAGASIGFPTGFINVNGAAPYHLFCGNGSLYAFNGIILNISGTLNFSSAFVGAVSLSVVTGIYSAINNSGTVTGSRYIATSNSIINTGGAGASALPGNAVGTTNTGGQYI